MTVITNDSIVASGPTRQPAGWLLGPGVDALFVANLTWPLVPLLGLLGGFEMHEGLRFWQVYFVTAPHRWITLALVFLDRERFATSPVLYTGIAVVAVTGVLAVRFSTGALTCLFAVDYAWNAWHFAAQHHGVFRLYERQDTSRRTRGSGLVRHGLRGLVLYVAFRVAVGTWRDVGTNTVLQWIDVVLLGAIAALLVLELVGPRRSTVAARTYLVSVVLLYGGLLLAVHRQRPDLVLLLATASALFHATEYLAVVSWSVRRRHGGTSSADAGTRQAEPGLFARFASCWLLTLTGFALVLGLVAWSVNQRWVELWLGVNLVAAFLHYAYDGIIWRVPRRRNG